MPKFEAKNPALVSYREHVAKAIDDFAPQTWTMKSAQHKFTDHTRKSFDRGLNVKACVDAWMKRYAPAKDEEELLHDPAKPLPAPVPAPAQVTTEDDGA